MRTMGSLIIIASLLLGCTHQQVPTPAPVVAAQTVLNPLIQPIILDMLRDQSASAVQIKAVPGLSSMEMYVYSADTPAGPLVGILAGATYDGKFSSQQQSYDVLHANPPMAVQLIPAADAYLGYVYVADLATVRTVRIINLDGTAMELAADTVVGFHMSRAAQPVRVELLDSTGAVVEAQAIATP